MWDKIANIYEGYGKVKKAKLQTSRRKFESLNTNDEEDIATFSE